MGKLFRQAGHRPAQRMELEFGWRGTTPSGQNINDTKRSGLNINDTKRSGLNINDTKRSGLNINDTKRSGPKH